MDITKVIDLVKEKFQDGELERFNIDFETDLTRDYLTIRIGLNTKGSEVYCHAKRYDLIMLKGTLFSPESLISDDILEMVDSISKRIKESK